MYGIIGMVLSLTVAEATVLAVGKLEACLQSGGSTTQPSGQTGDSLQCSQRFVVTLSVQNGETGTESVSSYSLDKAFDEDGRELDVLDDVTVTLSKSAISLRYPLIYEQDFNSQPYELILTRDQDGDPYRWPLNQCRDDPDDTASACGVMIDSNSNTAVPYSHGFCCKCSLQDYVSSASSISRANLQCQLLSSNAAQGAHCLRFSKLWYSAFQMRAPVVDYTVTAHVQRCRQQTGASPSATNANGTDSPPRQCTETTVSLGPSVPGACVNLPVGADDDGDNGIPCTVLASLEGDFAAFESAPDYGSKYMMIPLTCNSAALCGSRVLETSDRWMMVDKHAVTLDGTTCNKIGVSHEAFYSQSQRCDKYANSCLDNQLEDLYQADLEKETEGKSGDYFVKFQQYGDKFNPELRSSDTAAAVFQTNRFQKSVVTLMLDADSIRWTIKVSPASITQAEIENFEAMSSSGYLLVDVQNDGTVAGTYYVQVNCSEGIAPVPAQPVSLAESGSAGDAGSVRFSIYTTSTFQQAMQALDQSTTASSWCRVTLVDSIFRTMDATRINFTVSHMVQDKGTQGGNLSDGAPTNSTGTGQSGPGRLTNSAEEGCAGCFALNLYCHLARSCFAPIMADAAVLLGIAALGFLAFKYPSLLFCPCRTLCGCLCSGGGDRDSDSSGCCGPSRSSDRGRKDRGSKKRERRKRRRGRSESLSSSDSRSSSTSSGIREPGAEPASCCGCLGSGETVTTSKTAESQRKRQDYRHRTSGTPQDRAKHRGNRTHRRRASSFDDSFTHKSRPKWSDAPRIETGGDRFQQEVGMSCSSGRRRASSFSAVAAGHWSGGKLGAAAPVAAAFGCSANGRHAGAAPAGLEETMMDYAGHIAFNQEDRGTVQSIDSDSIGSVAEPAEVSWGGVGGGGIAEPNAEKGPRNGSRTGIWGSIVGGLGLWGSQQPQESEQHNLGADRDAYRKRWATRRLSIQVSRTNLGAVHRKSILPPRQNPLWQAREVDIQDQGVPALAGQTRRLAAAKDEVSMFRVRGRLGHARHLTSGAVLGTHRAGIGTMSTFSHQVNPVATVPQIFSRERHTRMPMDRGGPEHFGLVSSRHTRAAKSLALSARKKPWE